MPFLHCTTFSICADNAKAAKAFLAGVKEAGYDGELVVVDEAAVADALERGAKSAPVAVSHNAPSDVSVKLSVDVELAHDAKDEGLERVAAKLADDADKKKPSK